MQFKLEVAVLKLLHVVLFGQSLLFLLFVMSDSDWVTGVVLELEIALLKLF